ncbi:MAG TPA: hypothetical protein VK932_02960 [Kofleriaceae bacterium]|nr:hypothetical protein [Kofleriaceae bacterium]
MNGAVSPAGDPHPGQIEYDDRVEDRTWTRSAADVPQAIAWVKVGERWRPVVRFEIVGAGDQREITSFGPNHEFLETTTARMSAAPPPSGGDPELVPVPVPTPTPSPK